MIDENPDYKVMVNGFEFEISKKELLEVNLLKKSENHYHLLSNHQSINARIIQDDILNKKIRVELEGTSFEVCILDELDQMLDQMGFGKQSNKQIKEIKAPMPGLVLEINVIVGQQVKEGDKLLILAAMKMENSILLHTDGIIKHIAVAAGAAVDKGQVLIELE